jgi:hypothetical protein
MLRLPRGFPIARIAVAGLLRAEDLRTVLTAPSVSLKPNPVWVEAPYDAAFMILYVQPRSYLLWPRKQRLKWKRRKLKQARKSCAVPPILDKSFLEVDWQSERNWITCPSAPGC